MDLRSCRSHLFSASIVALFALQSAAGAQSVFINEIHYDNASTDSGEAIEIAGPAGTDLSGWSVVLYNGNTPAAAVTYDSDALSGTIPDQGGGFGTVSLSYPSNGIQNGGNDAIALVDGLGAVVQFLSYEGVATASNGPAAGMTSTDIGVVETGSDPAGYSLQLVGSGTAYGDFTWQAPAAQSFGAVNAGQSFGGDGGGGGGGGGGFSCGAPATLISAVQGSGASAAITGAVTIEGVVVADFQGSTGLGGFYVQEEPADEDGVAETSEGIFVYSNTEVAVGDVVRIAGTAGEFSGQTQISNLTNLAVCASGNTSIVPTEVALPFAAAGFAERYEGMLVRFPQQLSVTNTYTLGRYGEVLLSSGGRLIQPTQNSAPGAAANAAQVANDLNQIVLDDANNQQNRDPIVYPGTGLTAFNTLRGDDSVTGLTGVLGEGFGAYRVQPTVAPLFVADNPRTAAPELPGTGSLRVASFNVLNYFNGDGNGGGFPTSRGAETPEEFARQRDKIIAAITAMRADVVGLIEIENDGYGADSAIADLVDGLNEAAPAGTRYAFVHPGVAAIGTDQIAVGFAYRVETVEPLGSAAILDSSVDPLFNDQRNRPALAQTFREIANGERFTAVINHFKSKGSACTAEGDPDTGDGQGNCNITRTNAATALAGWLATDPTGSQDPDVLILGDLNSYAMEDPIAVLAGAGYHNLEGPDAVSYSFGGQWGTLDYALANAALAAQVTGAAPWAINADEPIALDYNSNFKSPAQQSSLYNADPYRSSDHDPVVVELALYTPPCDADVIRFSTRGAIPATKARPSCRARHAGARGRCLRCSPGAPDD